MPSDFEIGQVKWWTGEYDSDINGYTCTLKNVTKTDSYSYVVASIQNKDNTKTLDYVFTISTGSGPTVSIVGDRGRKVTYGKSASLEVTGRASLHISGLSRKPILISLQHYHQQVIRSQPIRLQKMHIITAG